jgi:hypothetical protein
VADGCVVRRVLLVLALACGAPWATARAESGDDAARARLHFEVGRGQYNLGNYTEAIREFTAGYALEPKPGFLLNLAQAHRRLGHFAEARDLCVQYLARASTEDPARAQIEGLIHELDGEIASHPAPPIAAAAPPHTPPLPVAPPRRRWLAPVVVVVVLAVLAGAATALALTLGSPDYAAKERSMCTGSCLLFDGLK